MEKLIKTTVLRPTVENVSSENVASQENGDWEKLCVHPDALFYKDCLCYNSKFCRKKCEYRNKTK